jgi:hypothetical protein
MKLLSERNELFRNIIINADLFTSFGFIHDGNIPSFNDEKYTIVFNSLKNRKIEITLMCGEIFVLSVLRETREDPGFNYEGGFYSFRLSHWLNWTQYPYDKNKYPFYQSSYDGDFEEKIEGFLTFLEKAFNDSTLLPTIKGEVWGYFPFDWGHHK